MSSHPLVIRKSTSPYIQQWAKNKACIIAAHDNLQDIYYYMAVCNRTWICEQHNLTQLPEEFRTTNNDVKQKQNILVMQHAHFLSNCDAMHSMQKAKATKYELILLLAFSIFCLTVSDAQEPHYGHCQWYTGCSQIRLSTSAVEAVPWCDTFLH